MTQVYALHYAHSMCIMLLNDHNRIETTATEWVKKKNRNKIYWHHKVEIKIILRQFKENLLHCQAIKYAVYRV